MAFKYWTIQQPDTNQLLENRTSQVFGHWLYKGFNIIPKFGPISSLVLDTIEFQIGFARVYKKSTGSFSKVTIVNKQLVNSLSLALSFVLFFFSRSWSIIIVLQLQMGFKN
jgi:hypothetical protein